MFIRRLQKRYPMLSSPGVPLIQEYIHLEVRYGPVICSVQWNVSTSGVSSKWKIKRPEWSLSLLFPMPQWLRLPRRREYREKGKKRGRKMDCLTTSNVWDKKRSQQKKKRKNSIQKGDPENHSIPRTKMKTFSKGRTLQRLKACPEPHNQKVMELEFDGTSS